MPDHERTRTLGEAGQTPLYRFYSWTTAGAMLNLNDLRLFALVARYGGFTAASRALGVPKSTLSKRVGVLEQTLGARLIQRSSRQFAVTDVGRDCLAHAATLLDAAEAAELAVKGRLGEPTGLVRLTASVPTTRLMLAPILPEIAARWPKLRLALHATDRFVDVVRDGFDLAVRDHFGPLPDSDLVQRRIGHDPGILVAAPAYVARLGAPLAPEDLAGLDGLTADPSETLWPLESADGRRLEVAPRPRFHADDAEALLCAAVAGLGIARLPARLCRADLERGALCRVLPDWTSGGVTTTLLIPHRRGQLPAVRVVADFLVARLGGAGDLR